MQCKTLHKKLIFFLEGDLSKEENHLIENHLAECPACSGFVSEMSKTLGIIEVEKTMELNPFFYTRLKAKLENQAEVQQPYGRPVLLKVLQPAIFSLVLLLGIYGGIKIGQPHQTTLNNELVAEQEMIPYLNEMDGELIEAFLME